MSEKSMIKERKFGMTKLDQMVFLSQSDSIPPMPKPIIIETQLDKITCISLDLPENTKAESQTWTWNPCEIHSRDGKLLAYINNIKLTLICAKESANSYRYYMTFRQDWTTYWWWASDFDQSILFENDAGGLLYRWDFRAFIDCGLQNRPISFMQDIDIVTFDLIKPGEKHWYYSSSIWRQCQA